MNSDRSSKESSRADDQRGLRVEQDGHVRRITLSRPNRRNALSRSMVAALREEFAAVIAGHTTRVVVLSGDGPSFCAGGDIAEFAESAATDQARSDAEGLADLLASMTDCPVPIVARVHGAAFGGGCGLVCAADIAIAAHDTRFSLSEARLGLVPAVISPYVLNAIGPRQAKAFMLLASPFDAITALRSELIHKSVSPEELDSAVDGAVRDLLQCAPGALALIKRLPGMLIHAEPSEIRTLTTDLLVQRLLSDEGLEGLNAFVEKRLAQWVSSAGEIA